jgi:hypothetical protein
MILDCTICESYAEINKLLGLTGDEALSNDRNTEDPAVIVYVRKWTWDGGDEDGPSLGFLGLDLAEHVQVGPKTDVFIYTR